MPIPPAALRAYPPGPGYAGGASKAWRAVPCGAAAYPPAAPPRTTRVGRKREAPVAFSLTTP